MLWKLQKITFLKKASEKKFLLFSDLQKELHIEEEIKLNSLLFDCFTEQLFKGKIDEERKEVKIIEVKPRDYIQDWQKCQDVLKSWIKRIDNYENYLNKQNDSIRNCNDDFTKYLVEKEALLLEKVKK